MKMVLKCPNKNYQRQGFFLLGTVLKLCLVIRTSAQECVDTLKQTCEPCIRQRESYNCSLPGLKDVFEPGQYEGVKVNYLSFATSTSSPNFPVRAKEFEACTGGRIVFSEAKNVWEDPIADLGTSTAQGQQVYDGYFMSYSHFPEASALNLAEHLQDRIARSMEQLDWADVLPKVKTMGEYRLDNTTNIDFLMYDGDFFVPVVRLDILEKHNISLPNTWDELVDIATRFNGTDLNDDGEADDFGFCHFPRLGAGFWDWWWAENLYGTWASYAQTDGISQGFFFDENTMEPLVNNQAFRKSAEVWNSLWSNGADGCITNNFSTGRCAIGLAPPGCWKSLFLPGGGVKREVNGTVVWRPTMKDGTYAEPYRFLPFGTTKVLNPTTGELEECNEKNCPNAEPIPKKGHITEGFNTAKDRANILPESPLAGKLINRAPFYWSGGLGTLIRESSPIEKKDLMWDFFVYTNSPSTSVNDVANYNSWLDSWRTSQLLPGNNFAAAGWSDNAYAEHANVMTWALSKDSNGALNLRIPGLAKYTRDVVGTSMALFINNNITMDELVNEVDKGWRKVTDEEGKIEQLQIYRAALLKDPLTEVEICRQFRELMDQKDPSVCRKYDPESTNMVIIIAVIASLGSLIVIGIVTFGIWWVLRTYRQKKELEKQREKQYEKMIQDAINNINGLLHPMVVIKSDKFLDIGKLVSYEELRDKGDLKVLDTMERVKEFKKDYYIVFLSHQWLGWGNPDPDNIHYDAMCKAVYKAPEMIQKSIGKKVELDEIYVWVDFVSISQKHRGLQALAIGALPVYASAADIFTIIAPDAIHLDNESKCDHFTYNMRGWCRAEMLSKICASGLKDMYLVSGDGVDAEPVTEKTPLDFKLFKGDFSCCQLNHKIGDGSCDKESLRVPALGLYSVALRRSHDEHVSKVLKNMKIGREEFFPTTYTYRKENGSEERELFGPLIEKVEKYVDENHPKILAHEEAGADNTPPATDSDDVKDEMI